MTPSPSKRWRFLGSGRRLPGSPLAVLLLVIAVAAGGWNFVEGSRTRAEAALPVGALSFGKALSGEVQPEVA